MNTTFIVPAVNEEKLIKRAIDSVRGQKGNEARNIEILVICNGTTDNTVEVAKLAGATVIETPGGIGVSRARNIGAAHAQDESEMLIFMDADSYIADNVLEGIEKRFIENSFGTVLGRPDVPSLLYSFFFFIKNIFHICGWYKGALGGVMFFDKKLFKRIGGYAPHMAVDEIYEISRRARKYGGKYVLVRGRFAYTSMRRFEKYGPIRMTGFWLKTRFMSLIGKKAPSAGEYQAIED